MLLAVGGMPLLSYCSYIMSQHVVNYVMPVPARASYRSLPIPVGGISHKARQPVQQCGCGMVPCTHHPVPTSSPLQAMPALSSFAASLCVLRFEWGAAATAIFPCPVKLQFIMAIASLERLEYSCLSSVVNWAAHNVRAWPQAANAASAHAFLLSQAGSSCRCLPPMDQPGNKYVYPQRALLKSVVYFVFCSKLHIKPLRL
eukprot:TRINITY_DN561_c0_g1_i5.p1 TRINITY_DN561_c0_g1~~TRINITY_DN561_c0_g1_i5.p1  ORF type:complete len:201 (+),score=1.84 TRINITY_DN561_c0_g1_i5:893-1495(+)